MRIKAGQSLSKIMNQRMILDIIRCEKAISRRDLALQTGLSGGAVTMLVQDFIDAGLVIEGEAKESSGGRRPIPLSIDNSSRRAIGIKLREGGLEATVTDLAGTPQRIEHTALSDTCRDTVVASIRSLVERFAGDSTNGAPVIGIGLALPGFVDAQNGVVRRSDRLGWVDLAIADDIAAACRLPTWVENDANAYAIAHRLFGLAQNASSALIVVLGLGVGAAIIHDGRILPGAQFQAGEIGFFRPQTYGPAGTSLGEQHAFESVLRKWSAQSPISLAEALAKSDELAFDVLATAGRQIGEMIALMIQLIDPAHVVIGGENMAFGAAYMTPMLQAIRKASPTLQTAISFDTDNNLWTRGAAIVAINRFFELDSRMKGLAKGPEQS